MPSDVTTETMANEAKNILDNCQGRAGSAAFVVKSGDAANAVRIARTPVIMAALLCASPLTQPAAAPCTPLDLLPLDA